MTLKEVRYALKVWGRFWSSKEQGLGFASRSITATMMEIGLLGVSSRSDKHLYSHGSEGVFVPDHITEIDNAVSKFLRINERQIIRAVYVQNKKPTEKGRALLIQAELALSRHI